jgi:hypothetical protein
MQSRRPFLFRIDSSTLWVRLAAAVPLALFIAAILAACGGPEDPEAGSSEPAAQPQAIVVQPLLDDNGIPSATNPAARPADPGISVANGRYATAAQAELLMEALGADAVEVTVPCCVTEVDRIGLLSMWIDEVASSLPESTAVLVRGSDVRLAALAANRIASGGLPNVWLVTQ